MLTKLVVLLMVTNTICTPVSYHGYLQNTLNDMTFGLVKNADGLRLPRGNLDFLDAKFLEQNFKESTKDYMTSKGIVFYKSNGVERIDLEKSKEALSEMWLLIEFGRMAKQQLLSKGMEDPFYNLSDSQILETIKSLPSNGLHYRHTLWLFVNLAGRLENFMSVYGMKSPYFF